MINKKGKHMSMKFVSWLIVNIVCITSILVVFILAIINMPEGLGLIDAALMGVFFTALTSNAAFYNRERNRSKEITEKYYKPEKDTSLMNLAMNKVLNKGEEMPDIPEEGNDASVSGD